MAKATELQDFYAYENEATFDKVRRLKWCNDTFRYAIEYYNGLGIDMDVDSILSEITGVKIRAVLALLYGALRAEYPKVTIGYFNHVYQNNNITEYIDVVIDGIKHYMAEPDKSISQELDLDKKWPDTQAELKKKELSKKQTGDSGSGSRKGKWGYRLKNSGE